MVLTPSQAEMEAERIDALSKNIVGGLEDIPEGTYAVRISKKGHITFLTKEEYDKLWQNK